ncbi:MAG: vitamin K epoxide reductase family protein [Longimicrobiales bacterium]
MSHDAMTDPLAGDAVEPGTEPAPPLNRMVVAVLALVGMLISTYMLLYHVGLIGTIACGTGGCQTVQNSPWANFLGVPVPLIGLLGYGMLFVTALLGTRGGGLEDRRVAAVLFLGGLIGLGFSLYLTYLEMYVINAWCRWCIGSTIVATLLFAAAIPEFARMRRSTS